MNKILGSSPVTSIIGYLIAGLTAADALLKAGDTNWGQIVVAVLMGILGRVAADSKSTTPKN